MFGKSWNIKFFQLKIEIIIVLNKKYDSFFREGG